MKKFLLTYILSLIVILGYSTQYEYNTAGGGSANFDGTPERFGQTFTIGTIGTNESFVIDSLRVAVNRTANYAIIFEIYAVSGGYPTGSALSSGQISADGVPIYNRMVEMTPAALSASTQYALVVYSTASYTNLLQPWYSTSNNYTGGISLSYNGSSWSEHSTNWDLGFYIYGKHAPIITTQPVSITRCVGTSATFSVVVDSDSPTYQWRKGGSNIGGATSSSYTIPSVALGSAGNYDCVVTESLLGTTTTSSTATLTVPTTTSITSHPSSISRCVGTSATFSVTASGTSLTYQWKKNGSNISGATSTSYTISSVATGDAANYTVTITGTCGTVTSNTAVLTVNTSPSITVQPISQTKSFGESVTFSVTATGSGLTYQWKKDGVNISSETSSSYTISSVSGSDEAGYTCYIQGTCGNTTSSTATLTVTGCADNLTDNLVGYWEMNETSGTTATDIHYTLDGVIGAGVTLNQSGKLGTSFLFNRLSSTSTITLSLTDPLLMLQSYDFSISVWVKPTEFTSTWRAILGGETGAFVFGTYGSSGELRAAKNDVEGITGSGLYLTLNQWNHIVITRDYSESKLTYYLNGVSSTVTYSGSFTSGASTYVIGGLTPTLNIFQGYIDELAIYRDRILSQNDVDCLYDGGDAWSYPFLVSSPPAEITFRKKILLASKLRNILLNKIERDFGQFNYININLANNQNFLTHSGALTGEYVGQIQYNPNVKISSDPYQYIMIEDTSGLFAISDSTIYLQSTSGIQKSKTYRIQYKIKQGAYYDYGYGYIYVADEDSCYRIDPNGTGDALSWSTYDNNFSQYHYYLQKRGTTINVSSQIDINATGVTIGAYGSGSYPIVYLNVAGSEKTFYSSGIEDITIRDIQIQNRTNDALQMVNFDNVYPQTTIIDNCIFTRERYVLFARGDRLKILNCDFHEIMKDGIQIWGVDTTEIACNIIYDYNNHYNYLGEEEYGGAGGGGDSYYGDGIQYQPASVATYGSTYTGYESNASAYVHNNYIKADETGILNKACVMWGTSNGIGSIRLEDNYLEGDYSTDVVSGLKGLYIAEGVSGAYPDSVIIKRMFFKDFATMIRHDAGSLYTKIENCAFNHSYENIRIERSTDSVLVYNCTFYDVQQSGDLITIYSSASGIDLKLRNNIFYLTQDVDIRTVYGNYSTDYNDYYPNATSRDITIGANDIEEDPLFDSELRLSAESPCIDNGTYLGINIDLNGLPVSGVPDMGAYQYYLTNPLLADIGNYYISNDGDDNNSGLSQEYPWETLSRLNSIQLSPGDTVFLNGGNIFEGELIFNDSGNSDSSIVIRSYGSGKATISGSNSFTDPSQSYYMHYYNVPTVTDDYYTIADLQGYGGESGSAYYDMDGGYDDPEIFYNASGSNILVDIDTDNYYYKDNKENTVSADFTLTPYETKILYKLAK